MLTEDEIGPLSGWETPPKPSFMTFVPAIGVACFPTNPLNCSLGPGALIGLETGYTHSVINLIGARAISLYEILAGTSATTAV